MGNSNEYMRIYVLKRYHRLREEWIERKGGVCVRCGSTDNLEFDHIDAAEKEWDIGRILSTHSKEKVEKEMAKCQLLCDWCHILKSQEEGDVKFVQHGGGATGKRNCYCDLCKPLKVSYNQAKGYRKPPKVKRPYVCGEYRTYKHGCKCDKCREANTIYMQNLREKKLDTMVEGC